MSILTDDTSLARVVDDHINWLVEWHRLAFIVTSGREELTKSFLPPIGFLAWFKGPARQLPQDQPIIDRLAVLHDQMHTLARLVLMKTPDGQIVNEADYNAVIGRYQALMGGLRQLERAFAIAASGLDLLTGLRSRVGLAEDLQREQGRYGRTGKPFCIAMADIDHFKAINDTHGHDVGDHVLAATADIISRSVRTFDDAYRLGGEEFLIVLKETDLTIAQTVIERLRETLAGAAITPLGRTPLSITASFGLLEAKREQTIEEMLHAVDQALYRAKKGGRNRVEIA
jgi:diguanylate cyclase